MRGQDALEMYIPSSMFTTARFLAKALSRVVTSCCVEPMFAVRARLVNGMGEGIRDFDVGCGGRWY